MVLYCKSSPNCVEPASLRNQINPLSERNNSSNTMTTTDVA
ncbi:hypothetical protein VHA_003004 [Grimontia hollisae CIP 101886]|uniref:Uncharacterized protein n=1 Tax=Grimontia hollisae CIP 101886 TaxID=675812 RepID=D0IB77_GRIHO|nr:hypothetical protein VHA_003004 [Grimontia hollisae CIP 101886]